MLNHLLKSTNALRNHIKTVDGLVDENISLKGKNRLLWAGLIGLSALSTLSIGSCRENAKNLKQENQANASLNLKLDHYKKEVQELSLENIELRRYVGDAESFANSIHVPYPDLVDGKTEEEEKTIEMAYEKELKAYDDACKVLGINQKQLLRLQKGLER